MIYSCPMCEKLFNQESSHARHVQYCRRQAAVRRASRPQACHGCRMTKTKCDFQQPCSRCVAKHIPCSYAKGKAQLNHPPQGPLVTAAPSFSTLMPLTNLSLKNLSGFADASQVMFEELDNDFLCGTSNFLNLDLPVSPFSSGECSIIVPAGLLQLTDMVGEAPRDLTLRSGESGTPRVTLCSLSPDLVTPPMFSIFSGAIEASISSFCGGSVSDLESWSKQYISHAGRQLIISIIRTFPRMIGQPHNLPPIVHHLTCGSEYIQATRESPMDLIHGLTSAGDPGPSKSLAACMSISQVFTSKILNSRGFWWTMVDSERRRIGDEMGQFTQSERLASIQALVIYTIMRLIDRDSGHRYFAANRELITTMKNLAQLYATHCNGPFSPPRTRTTRPSWEEWVDEETRRRVVIVCFLMALVIGGDACTLIMNPYSIPLPSEKALWEARSRWEWESLYNASVAEQPKFESLGDLVMAKHGGDDGVAGVIRGAGAGDGAEEALDDWHAGLDGIGMMIAAVLANL